MIRPFQHTTKTLFWIADCAYLSLIGDGFCNDETNNANCNYDQGDCCYSNINTELCSECVCYYEETCAADAFPKSNKYLDFVTYYSSFNDGICNNETRE